jgi:hypothetical protein
MPTQADPVNAERKEELPNLIYRSKLKRAIQLEVIRNPTATDREICSLLDEAAVELPDNLKEGSNRSFLNAYHGPERRRKIQILISKVRADTRKAKIL